MVIDEDSYRFDLYTEGSKGNFKSDFDVSCFTAEDLEAARKKIAEAGTTARECYEWALGVENGDCNAMIALMLTLMPNLQVLNIDIWTHPDLAPSILIRMLDRSGRLQRERQLGHPFALWSLKNVVVRYYYSSELDNIVHHLMSLLIIPSVESLSAIDQNAAIHLYGHPSVETDVDEKNLAAALHNNNLGQTSMKELSLSFAIIRPKALFQLLRYYPNLKRFYNKDGLGLDYESLIDIDDFRDVNLMTMVSCQSPHLECLAILSWGYNWSYMVASSTGSLNSLKNLRHLEITWPTFANTAGSDNGTESHPSCQCVVDTIPPSLERLSIIGSPSFVGRSFTLDVFFKIL
ncbi:hypothetical protein V492_06939 [Pseudogymnoascus sp. VKM F-4246]|nr:hypothetical protein V492_06939 [Pseudogymnoascus sp. VKM F-4246]